MALRIAWLLLLAALAAGQPPARTEVGPAVCHPDCSKHGTCGEDGFCRCPFGRLGEACETDFLAPCRQFPDTEALCGSVFGKSCECLRRCREWFCIKDSGGWEFCHGLVPRSPRACYEREGVPPDQQYSKFPEPGEKGVKCYTSWEAGAAEADCSTVATLGVDVSFPLSKCPDQCSKRGWVTALFCFAHCTSTACLVERDVRWDHLFALFVPAVPAGRGECIGEYCHCKPPYFSIDCSRSKVYPPAHSLPSPVDFKIYIYEIPTRLSYENKQFAGWSHFDQIYVAWQMFLRQFLVSSVRTEDPSAANLFFLGDFVYGYTGNTAPGNEHFHLLIDHVKHRHPYWNATNGTDHFLWSTTDRGGCYLQGDAQNAIKLVHFGMTSTPNWHSPVFPHVGHPNYGCTHPLRDVVTPPHDLYASQWLQQSLKLTLDEMLALKKRMLFFSGGILPDVADYSGGSRAILHRLAKEWADPDYVLGTGDERPADFNYHKYLRTSKFCLSAYGHGWGIRMVQIMLNGCVPLIVQEYVLQSHEEVLPYETFSIRLTNEDLPHLREILRGISEEQYRSLLQGVRQYMPAFAWDPSAGGRAFDYTIASLRRRYLNYKASYYNSVYMQQ
ncbi:hypothetical protein ABPG75_010860 [Micractinium tetrahymenae]